MKINNETKIGLLAIVSIALLIFGFNYLKGKSLLSKSVKLYAVFHSVNGLAVSNPVTINGLQVGIVNNMVEQNANLDSVIITINLDKEINIPNNSLAFINRDLLGTASLNIEMGNSKNYLKDQDTLNTQVTAGLIDDVKASLNPALNNVNGTLKSLDSVIEVIGGIFNPATNVNIQKIFTNLTTSSANLQTLLNTENGALAKTMGNLNSVTGNLAKQNESINATLANLNTVSNKLAALNLDSTISNLNSTVTALNSAVQKVNSTDGSVGLLLNDKKLYQNLESTSQSLNTLLDDLRVHPKRYVNISIFGRKDKANYLTKPLADSTNMGNK